MGTVAGDGEPRCRTVVFRGFVELASAREPLPTAMKMITDARSEKVAQILARPACEMVWWFSKSSEQYRISGNLRLVGADSNDASLLAARKQQWGNLSDQAREQFYWKAPGVAYAG